MGGTKKDAIKSYLISMGYTNSEDVYSYSLSALPNILTFLSRGREVLIGASRQIQRSTFLWRNQAIKAWQPAVAQSLQFLLTGQVVMYRGDANHAIS